MRELWSTELSPEETESLLRKAAEEIRKRRMEVPAILYAEMNKPIANVAGHFAVVMSPLLVALFGFTKVNEYSQLFSRRENWERLIQLLEEPRSQTLAQEV
jgi:hypothetical protein